MADTGYVNPTNDWTSLSGSPYVGWTNRSRIRSEDGSYSTSEINGYSSPFTNYSTSNVWGKTYLHNVPSTATIDGIEARMVAHRVITAGSNIVLDFDGGNFSKDAFSTLPGSAPPNPANHQITPAITNTPGSVHLWGGPNDLWFGETWTPAEVNSANFSAGYIAQSTFGQSSSTRNEFNVDVIQTRIYYTAAPIPDISGIGGAVAKEAQLTGSGTFVLLITGSGSASADESSAIGFGTSVPPTFTGRTPPPTPASAQPANTIGFGTFVVPDITGSGTATSFSASTQGSGTFVPRRVSFGDLIADPTVVAGTAVREGFANGILIADIAVLTGQATVVHIANDLAGIPGLNVAEAQVSGAATNFEAVDASGTLTADIAKTPLSSAQVRHNVSAALQAQDSAVAGLAGGAGEATGDLQADAAAITSTAEVTHIAFGDLTTDSAATSGTVTVTRQASGVLVTQDAQVAGEADSGVKGAFGDLLGFDSKIVGTAAATHFASAALVAQAAAVAGDALSNLQWDASGDLQAQAATIDSFAFSTPPKLSRGFLIIDFALVSGEAFVTHMASDQGGIPGLRVESAVMTRAYAAVIGDIIGWCFVNQQVYIPGAEQQQAFFPGMEEEQVCV